MKNWFIALTLVVVIILAFWGWHVAHEATVNLTPSVIATPTTPFKPSVNTPVAPPSAKG